MYIATYIAIYIGVKRKDVTMIAIIDYDAGNTFNVQKALQHIGLDAY